MKTNAKYDTKAGFLNPFMFMSVVVRIYDIFENILRNRKILQNVQCRSVD